MENIILNYYMETLVSTLQGKQGAKNVSFTAYYSGKL